jgi:hypothetical protein
MKLTNQQIANVNSDIQSFEIKWYELEVELTDHFISIIEDVWDKNQDLTFYQAKELAHQRFGKKEYKAIEKQRINILQKEYNRTQRKELTEYLKFPKIVMLILALILVYKFSFYFESPVSYIKTLSIIVLGLNFIHMMIWLCFRKLENESFLVLEMTFRMTNSFMLGFYGFLVMTKDYLAIEYALPIACFLFVVTIAMILTSYHLTNKVFISIKNQYQLT